MVKDKGFAHLVLLLVVFFVLVGTVVYFLAVSGKVSVPFISQKPTVALKTEYKNPFDKNSQYVNPFDKFKSPFSSL